MANLRPLALAGFAAASLGWARAADLPPAPSLPPQTAADAEFGGWYLRGDIGVGVNSNAPEFKTGPAYISPAATMTVDNTTLSPFGMVDVGAGYQFNDAFRADATLEYRGGARLQSGGAAYPWLAPAEAGDGFRADLSSFVGLVNGYVTPGAWYGFSPFIGAGVGFADNRLSGAAWRGVADQAGGRFGGGSRTSFAWALMAGVDYDLTANLKLELSYRYLSYGTIATGGQACASCLGGPVESRNRLASNDFRLGLLYLIGGPIAPPAPALN
jgi:opacity protein-like surface antigen